MFFYVDFEMCIIMRNNGAAIGVRLVPPNLIRAFECRLVPQNADVSEDELTL